MQSFSKLESLLWDFFDSVTYVSIFIHTYILYMRIYTYIYVSWVYMKFREIRVFYFPCELASRRCEKRWRKISSAHRFREIRKKKKPGEKRFRSSSEFLHSLYTAFNICRIQRKSPSVRLSGVSVLQKFCPSSRRKFPREARDDRKHYPLGLRRSI